MTTSRFDFSISHVRLWTQLFDSCYRQLVITGQGRGGIEQIQERDAPDGVPLL
jgi:hypothetical protein